MGKDQPNPVKEQQVKKAVAALIKHIKKGKDGGSELFEDEQLLNLVISLKKTPQQSSNKPHRVDIPHPLYNVDSSEVCLLVKDRKGEGHKEAKLRVQESANCGVSKVIGVSKLKANYVPFEAKRKLCDQYDVFLADSRILPILPKLLGKSFFKKKKQPISVDLTKKDWALQIKKAVHATYLFLSGGNCLNIRVATVAMSEEEIVANVMAAIQNAVQHVPQKWKNVQALFLKSDESLALPLYTALPDAVQRIEAESDAKADIPKIQNREVKPATTQVESVVGKTKAAGSKPKASVAGKSVSAVKRKKAVGRKTA